MDEPKLTGREKDLLAEHLPYELAQLDACLFLATSSSEDDQERLTRLMAIDCFYLHARSLIEFYEGNEVDPTKTRVSARRFTKHPPSYPNFEPYRDVINDQVTHLQLERGVQAPRRQWTEPT